ncbi:hypothetical protein BOX15_Mlig029205g3 [Macrostomum lignano]|uniref:Saposin B-type domain-containing protein n=2 Tax=Macrostomum lignano TaxID=282301 RepID=A0A1I8GAE8_9PLAT|nr:hypothetical protein BOX15_Mlig029205g3 [Macrostomum lignano]
MFRFALLVVLPLVALCNTPSAPTNREDTLRMLEQYAKPCILNKINCPENVGWDFESFAPLVRRLHSLRLPSECSCNVTIESCVRSCCYAVMLRSYRQSAIAGKTDPTEIANAERQMMELFETRFRPCIVENRNCELIGGVSYEQIRSQVENAIKTYSMPDECNYEPETEAAIRACYYAIVKRSALAAFPDKRR